MALRIGKSRQSQFSHGIFNVVDGIGFVADTPGVRWKVEVKLVERRSIAEGTRRQEKLDRDPICGDDQVNLESIEVALLAGLIATISLISIKPTATHRLHQLYDSGRHPPGYAACTR